MAWSGHVTESVLADFHAIHVEIDNNFPGRGMARAIPPGGRLIDLQGFVF